MRAEEPGPAARERPAASDDRVPWSTGTSLNGRRRAQGIGAISGGLAITNPASFAARALIALVAEAILATTTIAWLRRKTPQRAGSSRKL